MMNEYQKLAKDNEEKKLLLIFEVIMTIIEIFFIVKLTIAVYHGKTDPTLVLFDTIGLVSIMVVILIIIVPLTTDVEICESGIRQTILNGRITTKSYLWNELRFVGRAFIKGDGRRPDTWFLVCSKGSSEYFYKNSAACIFKSKDTIYIDDIGKNSELLSPFFKQ